MGSGCDVHFCIQAQTGVSLRDDKVPRMQAEEQSQCLHLLFKIVGKHGARFMQAHVMQEP